MSPLRKSNFRYLCNFEHFLYADYPPIKKIKIRAFMAKNTFQSGLKN